MRARTLIVVAVVALGATACGSSSKTAVSPSPTIGPANSGTSSGGTPTTTAGSFDPSEPAAGLCADLKKGAKSLDTSSLVTSKTPKQISDLYAGFEVSLRGALAKAPASLKGDVATLETAVTSFANALKNAHYDFSKLDVSSIAGVNSPNFEAAAQHIRQYLAHTCQ